jgi:hypothetical protein
MRLPREVFVVVRRGAEFLIVHRSPPQGDWCCIEEAAELLYWPEPREVLRAFA